MFPKKGSFTDGICMCAQWQHRLFPRRRPAALPLVTSPVSFSPPSSFVCLALLHLICLFSFTPSRSFPSFPVHLVCRSLSASRTDLSSTIFLSRSLSLSVTLSLSPLPAGADHRASPNIRVLQNSRESCGVNLEVAKTHPRTLYKCRP